MKNGPSALFLLFAIFSNAAMAQTVELSSRTFWLGEVPSTLESDPPFIAPQRIGWLNEIIENDPILSETVFHIDMVPLSVPVSDTITAPERVARPGPGYTLFDSEKVPENLVLAGFRIFSPRSDTLLRFEYRPVDPSAGFEVGCFLNDDLQSISLCVVRATYPPDNLIWLMARLYFPDFPADRPNFFHQVVARMREFTYCLDVTDSGSNPQVENPSFTGCEFEVTS
jgi:hypothetical protein